MDRVLLYARQLLYRRRQALSQSGPVVQALKTLFFVPRYKRATILHPLVARYGKCKVTMYPRSTGSGCKASNMVSGICKLAGIQDIGVKVLLSGSAAFPHLSNFCLPASIAFADCASPPSRQGLCVCRSMAPGTCGTPSRRSSEGSRASWWRRSFQMSRASRTLRWPAASSSPCPRERQPWRPLGYYN